MPLPASAQARFATLAACCSAATAGMPRAQWEEIEHARAGDPLPNWRIAHR